mmetsp:Transcript_117100/g.233369  ORF Transcript_117100/g.233369 Transcript_117100/m.233369 type:complete len:232 (+) Transcript_117100:59-754(+)
MAMERVWRRKGTPDEGMRTYAGNWHEWKDAPPSGMTPGAARRERRQFAEVIVDKLGKLECVEKQVADLQALVVNMEALQRSIFTLLSSQMQGQAPMYSVVQGATHFVEVPRVVYVEKVIEIPQFTWKGEWENIGDNIASSLSSTVSAVSKKRSAQTAASEAMMGPRNESDVEDNIGEVRGLSRDVRRSCYQHKEPQRIKSTEESFHTDDDEEMLFTKGQVQAVIAQTLGGI